MTDASKGGSAERAPWPRNALIVKLGAIGDVTMALPTISALRSLNPAVRITWVCAAAVAPIIRATGAVDCVLEVDDSALLVGAWYKRVRELVSIWSRLAGRRFDVTLNLHRDRRYRLLGAMVVSADRRTWGGSRRRGVIPGRYHGDEYARLVTRSDNSAAVESSVPKLSFPSPSGAIDAILSEGHAYAVIAPGGARNVLRDDALRRWPLPHYGALAGILLRSALRVVVVGSETDSWTRPAFAGMQVDDVIGQTELSDLYALVAQAAVVVSHDSATMHLACLANSPLVALFGPTQASEKVRPAANRVVLSAAATLPCAPCYDGRDYAVCSDNLCLSRVLPETAAAEALRIARR